MIYEKRPVVCRVYPYMLHQEPDEEGNVDWRQISGLDKHGAYHAPISGEEALHFALETKSFEESVLSHEIAYLEDTAQYFREHGLRHVRKKYDDGLRLTREGAEIEVMVYFQGTFERWVVKAGTAVQKTLPVNEKG
jgi:Fe-S-cluster containining protein